METLTVTPRRRELAADYHGGQFTELYKVSSSGSYDSVSGLMSEVADSIKTCSIVQCAEQSQDEQATLQIEYDELTLWLHDLEKIV